MLLEIPLQNIPNQSLSISINQQPCTIILNTNQIGCFITFKRSKKTIFSYAMCNHACYLHSQNTDNFNGYLFFYDQESKQPHYENFNITCFLMYADYDILQNRYEKWVIKNKARLIQEIGI